MKNRFILITLLVLAAMATRFMPHWPNFTAVGAVALFSGAMFKKSYWAFIIPIAALYLSDLLINNLLYTEYYSSFQWFTPGFYFMYIGFIASVIIGRLAVDNKKGSTIVLGSLGAAIIFYLITNFGAWLGNPMYAQSIGGLITSYTAGLPFLANQVLGNLFYGAMLFSAAYALMPHYRKEFKVA